MSRRERSFHEKLDKAKAIYESVRQEYNATPDEQKHRFSITERTSAKIQLELSCSLRKAQEWLKLVRNLNKFNAESKNI
jgi:tRNA threonylcarbamoyladenosine modification (KEOPS) complex  Pcc1 subunit